MSQSLGSIAYKKERSYSMANRPMLAVVSYAGTRTLRANDGSHYEDPIYNVNYALSDVHELQGSIKGICFNLAKFHADCLVGAVDRY